MPRCFIHVGVHKTGTTSIQHLLSTNDAALQVHGFMYPQTGRIAALPGHHNLAWEISGDHRFSPKWGASRELINEIREASKDVVLSSEDFGSALHHEANFSAFLSLLQANGFSVTLVLYLRDQSETLPRIYLTLMHSGMRSYFDGPLKQVTETAQFRWRDWIFNFDYCDLINRMRELPNVELVVRSYKQAQGNVCADFLRILGLSLPQLNETEELLLNPSLSLREYLLMFLKNRFGKDLAAGQLEVIDRRLSAIPSQTDLSAEARINLLTRLEASNRDLFVQYGIPEPALTVAASNPNTLYVDQLFSPGMEAWLFEDLQIPGSAD